VDHRLLEVSREAPVRWHDRNALNQSKWLLSDSFAMPRNTNHWIRGFVDVSRLERYRNQANSSVSFVAHTSLVILSSSRYLLVAMVGQRFTQCSEASREMFRPPAQISGPWITPIHGSTHSSCCSVFSRILSDACIYSPAGMTWSMPRCIMKQPLSIFRSPSPESLLWRNFRPYSH